MWEGMKHHSCGQGMRAETDQCRGAGDRSDSWMKSSEREVLLALQQVRERERQRVSRNK